MQHSQRAPASGTKRADAMSKAKMLLSRLSSSEHGYLRKLAEAGLIDFPSIEAVIKEVVADRFRLARQLLDLAKAGSTTGVSGRRLISTCYYSMFHACRAVILLHGYVDRNDHEKMPQEIEKVLPGVGLSAVLEAMVSRRRCADYDPYIDFDPAPEAAAAITSAETMLSALEAFLNTAGVTL
jgi:uncharacterized protein (UPF0332 family)